MTSKALALRALGRETEALATIGKAREIILSVARDIRDLELRDSFLTNVDESARTLALAQAWLGE